MTENGKMSLDYLAGFRHAMTLVKSIVEDDSFYSDPDAFDCELLVEVNSLLQALEEEKEIVEQRYNSYR
jgi:hypothetical protein